MLKQKERRVLGERNICIKTSPVPCLRRSTSYRFLRIIGLFHSEQLYREICRYARNNLWCELEHYTVLLFGARPGPGNSRCYPSQALADVKPFYTGPARAGPGWYP